MAPYQTVRLEIDRQYRGFVQQTLEDTGATQQRVADYAGVSEATMSRVARAAPASLRKENTQSIMGTLGVPPHVEAAIRILRQLLASQQFERVHGRAKPLDCELDLNELDLNELGSKLFTSTKGVVAHGAVSQWIVAVLNRLPDGWIGAADDADDEVDLAVVRVVYACGILFGQWGEDRLALDAFEAVRYWPSLEQGDELVVNASIALIPCRCFLPDPYGAYRMGRDFLEWNSEIALVPDADAQRVFGALQTCVAQSHLLETPRYVGRTDRSQSIEVLHTVAERCLASSTPPYSWIVEAYGTSAALAASLGDDSWLDDLEKAQRALIALKSLDYEQYKTWKIWHSLDRARAEFHSSAGGTEDVQDFRDALREIVRQLDPDCHKDIYRRCAQILRWLEAGRRRSIRETTEKLMGVLLPFLVGAGYFLGAVGEALAHNTPGGLGT